jgi:cobalt-zinc-cadmium efflux system membrane fusion protein
MSRTLVERLPAIEFPSAVAARNCGIRTGLSEQRAMDEAVTASGIVGYDQTRLAQLSVRTGGVVWKVEKRVGDLVERGDVLVIVDSAEVGTAKANLLEAAVLFHLKSQTRQRLEGLQGSVALRTLREAEAAEEVARAQRFNALQRLVNLGFSLRLEDIEGRSSDEIAERLHHLGLPPSLDMESASANLIPLVAPFSGIVTRCDVVRGEVVDPSQPQYFIADITRMWINLDIRHEDCASVRRGAPVVFESEGGLPSVAGSLTWIGTEINPRTHTVQARAEVDNPALDDATTEQAPRRLLQANAFGSAHIVINKNPSAVVVPNEALHWQWELGQNIVFVPSADGCRFEPRVVRKGLVRDDYAEIVDGLGPGEPIVVEGSRILASELSETLQQRWGDNSDAVRGFEINTDAGE